MTKTTDFGKAIKMRLIQLGKKQTWLIEEVTAKTGLYFDAGYLWKIMAGVKSTPSIVDAIREILDLKEDV